MFSLEVWKRANIIPVHKKSSKNLKQNYRPISLLPILGKTLEKLMFDFSYKHLSLHELLNPNQSGFHPGDSTINQLISIVHSIFVAFDCNPPLDVRSVYGSAYQEHQCHILLRWVDVLRDFMLQLIKYLSSILYLDLQCCNGILVHNPMECSNRGSQKPVIFPIGKCS